MSSKPYRVEHVLGETLLYYREPVPMDEIIEYCNETFEDYPNMNIHLIRPSGPAIKSEVENPKYQEIINSLEPGMKEEKATGVRK